MDPPLPGRLTTDTLRGLACLLLVAFHVVGHSEVTGLRLPLEHPARQANEWLSLLRMPLFTFLSGLVYAMRPVRSHYGQFVGGKVRRLLVPMILVGTGFALLQSLASGTHAAPYDWELLHIVPVAHYWFLESLFLVFLLTLVMERYGWLDSPCRFLIVGAAAFALHVTAPVPVYFGLEGATYLLPFFLLGVAAVRFHAFVSSDSATVAATGLLIALVLYWSTLPRPLDIQLGPGTLAASLCGCLLLLRLRPQASWLAWIGRWSFGIYLFHSIFTAFSRIVLHRTDAAFGLPVLFFSGLVAGIAGPIALTAVLRRVPLGHLALGERTSVSALQPHGRTASAG